MKTKVLIFPAGEVNSIEILDALSYNVNIEVFGASSIDRHGSYVFRNYKSNLPLITDQSFFFEFNNLLNEWKIDFIFPTHDTVALFFSQNTSIINSKVIVSDYKTSLICRDKKTTYKIFENDFFNPIVYDYNITYPAFIKPREGQGSYGAMILKNEDDIPRNIDLKDYIITEYLPGKELTIDCLSDIHGELRAILPRTRNRTLAGISVSSETMNLTDEIELIASTINKRLKFFGLWYFQLKQDVNGKFKLLEISTRVAGTMCLSRARGVNLPLLSVYTALGREIEVLINPYSVKVDRTLISRYMVEYYYNKVFIDYDDTIINDEYVNQDVLKYLYQCKNKNIKIVLISRHTIYHHENVEFSLDKHSISRNLFTNIINIKENNEKFEYIDPSDSIFIDNSFEERKKVHNRLNIPVFDVEGIEVLIDWKK